MEKLFPDSFLRNQNWAYLWISILKFYTVCFYCMPNWGLSKYFETELQTTCFYLLNAFSENKKRSGTSFSHPFSAWFLKENISLAIFYYLTQFNYLVTFTSWDIGQYVYWGCLLTRLWRHNFSNQPPYLSNQAVFLCTWYLIKWYLIHDILNDIKLNILRMKKAFKMELKAFSITFEGLSLKQKKLFWDVKVRF